MRCPLLAFDSLSSTLTDNSVSRVVFGPLFSCSPLTPTLSSTIGGSYVLWTKNTTVSPRGESHGYKAYPGMPVLRLYWQCQEKSLFHWQLLQLATSLSHPSMACQNLSGIPMDGTFLWLGSSAWFVSGKAQFTQWILRVPLWPLYILLQVFHL